MNNRIAIAKEVNVPELFFKNEGRIATFPRRMEFDGREYTFMDGLRYLVQRGQQLVQVFDMTDGARDFRLQFDTGAQSWTLVDMSF